VTRYRGEPLVFPHQGVAQATAGSLSDGDCYQLYRVISVSEVYRRFPGAACNDVWHGPTKASLQFRVHWTRHTHRY
jgi:hypothetical protein